MTVEQRDEGFAAHQDAQLKSWASLSPLARLRWLVQAKRFTRRYLGAAALAGARALGGVAGGEGDDGHRPGPATSSILSDR